nr:xylulose kinase-1 [Tanacetum cinerariifolium]
MSSLFADTHNVVAILKKSDATEGFEQIINFLSGCYIHYALTVNPHIYISCIKQFWNTASVKRSGDVTRLQAQVDKKKIVISEVVIREILQLDDAEGVVCLPNDEIFAGLAQMGYEKSTSWNEFSIAMASAVICLSKGQRFNFLKYIFDSLGEALLANFQQVLDTCSALIRCVEHLERDNVAQKLKIVKLKAKVKKLEKSNKVKSLKFKRLRKVRASRRVESSDDMEDVFNQGRMIDDMDKDEGFELVKDAEVAESEGRHAAEQAEKQAEIYHIDLDHPLKVLSIQEDDSKVQEVVEVVTTSKLITVIVTAATFQVSAVSATIPAAKPSILDAAPTVDKGKGILVESPKLMKKKDQIELDTEYARKLHEEINKDDAEFNKDIDWDAAMEHVNQQSSKNP